MIPGLLWPALPAAPAQACLALLYQFDRSQWWQPDRLREQQFRQLQVLLDHARTSVPYYRERLRGAGPGAGQAISDRLWRELPILTRADLQAAGSQLHSSALPSSHGPARILSSSGSTGRPIQTLSTGLRQLFWEAITLREHLWHRRDASGRLGSIRAFATGSADYPNGVEGPNWGGSVAAVFTTGPACGLSVVSTVEQQAKWLVRHNPDYLLTFPSALQALAHYCREQSIELPRLRQARTISEVLTDQTRTAVRAAWGVEIADAYSANEVGYIALQCPECESLHVQSETVYVEILRDDGSPCEVGETGQVVVTDLHNFAMPLIRYAIGDIAQVGPPCACGRGLPVLSRILGRVRNIPAPAGRAPDPVTDW